MDKPKKVINVANVAEEAWISYISKSLPHKGDLTRGPEGAAELPKSNLVYEDADKLEAGETHGGPKNKNKNITKNKNKHQEECGHKDLEGISLLAINEDDCIGDESWSLAITRIIQRA